MTEETASPLVGIIMGSQSDWPTLGKAAETLDQVWCLLRNQDRQRPSHAPPSL